MQKRENDNENRFAKGFCYLANPGQFIIKLQATEKMTYSFNTARGSKESKDSAYFHTNTQVKNCNRSTYQEATNNRSQILIENMRYLQILEVYTPLNQKA